MKTQKRLSVLLTVALTAALATGGFAQGNGNGRGGGGGGGGGGGNKDKTAPAAVIDLQPSDATFQSITLTWTATGDDGVEGVAASYDLRYATFPIDQDNWNDAAQAGGEPVPGAPGTLEEYTLGGLAAETTFYIALRVVDEAGNDSGLSNVVVASTAAFPPTPWSTSLVDTENDPGRWSSVAFNPVSGFPAVAYHVTNHGRRRTNFDILNFASWNGSSWDIVEMIAQAFGPLDLEFDPNTGLPFIAFKCGVEVHVAWDDGGGWQTEMVDQSGSSSPVSLEFDPDGRPTLAYPAATQEGVTIRFARLVDGTWVTEDVGTVAPRQFEHGFDPVTGHPAIAYTFSLNLAALAFFDGSQWTTEIIDTAEVFAVSNTHLEFNPATGGAMVAYNEWPSFDPFVPIRIRLCERTGNGSWTCSYVYNDPEHLGSLYDFAVDSAGVPLVLYGVSGELIFSWWDDSSESWVDELVFPGGEFRGSQISLDLGPNGELAATFQVGDELIIGIR